MEVTLKDRVLMLNQEKIYSIYFGFSVEDINWSTNSNFNRLRNPFREDSNPSVSFKWFNNKLIIRDWGDQRYSGDVFKVVGYLLNLNCYVDSQFIELCTQIINDYYNCKIDYKDKDYNILSEKKEIKSIITKNRTLQRRDFGYFESYGLNKKSIIENIKAVSRFEIDEIKMGYSNSYNDPCYEYTINERFTKLYFPYRHKKSKYPRFITNNILQIDDITDIVKSDNFIIIKSLKDKLLINQFLKSNNIPSSKIQILTSSSETPTFKENIVKLIDSYCNKKVYTMFDSDNTGINSMKFLEQQYSYTPILFSSDILSKDPTDFYRKYGYNKTENRMLEIFNLILK